MKVSRAERLRAERERAIWAAKPGALPIPGPMPAVTYKFVDEPAIEHIVKHQNLKLGTADEYRRIEEAESAGRGDPEECRSVWKPGRWQGFVTEEHPILGRYFEAGRPGVWADLTDSAGFDVHSEGLIFSVSRSVTPEICARMREEFGAAAVFRIHQTDKLVAAVSRILAQPVASASVSYCDYDPRDALQADMFGDGFHKRPRFAWQDEARMVVGIEATEARIIHVPGLWRFMSKPRML